MAERRLFTVSDVQFLRENCDKMSVEEMANALGRPYISVYIKLHREALTFISKRGRPAVWHGCNETCPDYCPYPDCYKP